jgi:hypothetical protein
VFLTIFVFAAGGPAFTAGDWYVATTGNDLNDCDTVATPCQTIQAAINKASPGDTIHVAAGIYPEPAPGPLTVNKDLTLVGEQEGNDARTRAGAESVIADSQGTSISASGVVIDGFTVQDSALAAFTGFGGARQPSCDVLRDGDGDASDRHDDGVVHGRGRRLR